MTKGKPATKKERAKIVSLLRKRKVKFHPESSAAISRMKLPLGKHKPDFTVVGAQIRETWGKWKKGKDGNNGGVIIAYQTKSAGFGELTVVIENDGSTTFDTEGMGRDFVKQVFAKLAETGKIR